MTTRGPGRLASTGEHPGSGEGLPARTARNSTRISGPRPMIIQEDANFSAPCGDIRVSTASDIDREASFDQEALLEKGARRTCSTRPCCCPTRRRSSGSPSTRSCSRSSWSASWRASGNDPEIGLLRPAGAAQPRRAARPARAARLPDPGRRDGGIAAGRAEPLQHVRAAQRDAARRQRHAHPRGRHEPRATTGSTSRSSPRTCRCASRPPRSAWPPRSTAPSRPSTPAGPAWPRSRSPATR